MKDRLRVVLLSREYPPETGWGGIGTYTFNLARGLARYGHQVTVISLSPARVRTSGQVDGVMVHRLPCRAFDGRSFGVAVDMLAHSHAAAALLDEIVRVSGVDIIEFPDWWGEGLTFLWRRRLCRARVARVHGYMRLLRRHHCYPLTRAMRLQEVLEGVALKRATMLAPNTRWIAGQLADDYRTRRRRWRVQAMGIDTELFRAVAHPQPRLYLRQKLGIPSTAAVLFSVGRLEPRKGFEHLVAALAALKQRGVDAYLVIAGRDRGSGAALGWLAERHGIAERVRLVGAVPYAELPAWYAMCDVCAGAARGESPGLTYVEAMACARPVIALRDGGTPEVIVDGQTGILADSSEPRVLADALQPLLTSAELRARMGADAARHVAERFSLSVTIPQHVQLYDETLARAG